LSRLLSPPGAATSAWKYARRSSRMKSDPYPLHIPSAIVCLAIVVLFWAFVV
jgi:hypothetical protein